MTDPARAAFPGNVMLATDLSSRCDRPLDRAAQLARQWNARLHVVHAVAPPGGLPVAESMWDAPWRDIDDQRRKGERRLRNDLGPLIEELQLNVHVERGDPGTVILDLAEQHDCDLIVTGVARNETLGRTIVGDTVDFLVRKAAVPVLVVRNRVHGPYERVLATSDFSPASAEALEVAIALFPRARTWLLHAYRIPFSGILINDAIRSEFRELGEQAAREFLQSRGLPQDFPRIIEEGAPEELVASHVEDGQALVVVGSHGTSAASRILLGSTARDILKRTEADVLVVPFTKRAEG